MTQSVTIVNTSNWEGEMVEVLAGEKNDISIQLYPGESTQIHPSEYKNSIAVPIRFWRTGERKPFRDDEGKQVFPDVDVIFR